MQQKNAQTIRGSSRNYALSNHTTFSQTQTDATVTLNYSTEKTSNFFLLY